MTMNNNNNLYLLASDHLTGLARVMFEALSENEPILAQEMKREARTDYLNTNEYLTEDQYQEVISIQYDYKANQHLLQLVKREDTKYLRGFKEALRAAGQNSLLPYMLYSKSLVKRGSRNCVSIK